MWPKPLGFPHQLLLNTCERRHPVENDVYYIGITTSDNPYDPETQFDEWYAFDEGKGYHTCSYLARIARTSEALSDYDNMLAIESAIDEIVRLNVNGNYIKIKRKISPA